MSKERKYIFLALVVGVLVGIIYYTLNLLFLDYIGKDSDKIYLAAKINLDESATYSIRVREAFDGDIWEGDPFLSEYKKMPNIWDSNYMAAMFGSLLKIFGAKSINPFFSWGRLVFPAMLCVAAFFIFFAITKNGPYSIFSSIIALLFSNLPVFKKILSIGFWNNISFVNIANIFNSAFNYGLCRMFVPAPFLLFFLLFLYFVYKSIIGGEKKYLLAGGIIFGLLFYIYLYYWAFSSVFIFFLIVLLLLLRETKKARDILKIFILGGIISIPMWIKMFYLKSFPLYQEYAARVGMELSHSVRWASLNNYLIILAIIIFLFFYWKKNKNPVVPYLIALLLGAISVANAQVITGFNVQPDHWGSRVNVYVHAIVAFAVLWLLLKQFSGHRYFGKIFAGLSVIFLIMAVPAQLSTDIAYEKGFLPKDIYEAFMWLNNNTESGTVVATPSLYMNQIIPVLTHNNIYNPQSCLSLASNGEILERFWETNAIFKTKDAFIKKNFSKKDGAMDSDDYGDFLFCNTYHSAAVKAASGYVGKIPLPIAENIISLQKKFNKLYAVKEIKPNYRLDYLIFGPEEKLISNFKAESYNNIVVVYSNSSVKIYKVEPHGQARGTSTDKAKL